MIPTHRVSTHPGEILLEEFLKPLELTPGEVAGYLGVSPMMLYSFVEGHCGVTGLLAWRLSQAFGTTPEFWMSLQVAHDLSRDRPMDTIPRLNKERP